MIAEEQMEQELDEIPKRKGPGFDIETEGVIPQDDLNEEKRVNLIQRVLNFLWKIIVELPDVKTGNLQLVTMATNIIKDILSGKMDNEKIRFLEKSVNAIKKNLAVNEAFEVNFTFCGIKFCFI